MRTTDRLICLPNGAWIDPSSITYLAAIANAVPHHKRDGTQSMAKIILETKSRGQYIIPCKDMLGAKRWVDTLAALANYRGNHPKVETKTDYSGTPQPGDAGYYKDEEQPR